jgi:hypothetical protein
MPNEVGFDTEGTLRNFIDSYSLSGEEEYSLIIIESIANSLDALAKNIDLYLKHNKNDNKYVFSVLDDGKGMDKNEFENNYHRFSASSKTKGQGIGFAGVGAKLCFYFDKDIKVKTITRKRDNNSMYASLMRWDGINKKIIWEYIDINNHHNDNIPHKFKDYNKGTYYEIEIPYKIYHYLYTHIKDIVRKWYNAILLGIEPYSDYNIRFNGENITPNNINKIKEHLYKEDNVYYYFYLLDDYKDESVVDFVVYGKLIKNVQLKSIISNINKIKPEYRNKIYIICIANQLAEYLNFNKQDFRLNNKLYNKIKDKLEIKLMEWLKSIGAINEGASFTTKDMEVVKQFVAKWLQRREFKDFNPFLKSKVNAYMPDPDKKGEFYGSMSDGVQRVADTKGNKGSSNNVPMYGQDEGSGVIYDKKGDIPLTSRERDARNIAIRGAPYPDDTRESWVDIGSQLIIINEAHPIYKYVENKANSTVIRLHLLRIVIDALAYYKADYIANNDYKKISDLKQELYNNIAKDMDLEADIS